MSKKVCFTIMLLGLFIAAFSINGPDLNPESASIQGIITDSLGNPLPNVKVTAFDTLTKKSFSTTTNREGLFRFSDIPPGIYDLRAELKDFPPVEKKKVELGEKQILTVALMMQAADVADEWKLAEQTEALAEEARAIGGVRTKSVQPSTAPQRQPGLSYPSRRPEDFNTEEYNRIYENRYRAVLTEPLSTFSIDVDTASYANVRRFIRNHEFPPKDAVRIEEMINYFNYDYPLPKAGQPFSIYTEISQCPWNPGHRLVHLGIQGRKIEKRDLPSSNLVFLLDVSGSMNSPQKLPLLQTAFKLLVNELGPNDRVSIAVYAGAAGLILPSTSAANKETIFEAIDRLQAGGSTAGGAGIQLAYKTAEENFIKNGNNRIILATDGDFNIGVSSTSELIRMVEEKREKGIFLTILGLGMGNMKDGRMEQLADKGNGNYYYIDGLLEAKKVFIDDLKGTLFTIAKDVKIQVEFNPAKVKAYRLIGYENRLLNKEDFSDDTKDAGELGAGHTVTALYEIIPAGSDEEVPGIDPLKYQDTQISPDAVKSKEILTVKLRYKKPDEDTSRQLEYPLMDQNIALDKTSPAFRFSAAVAEFGMLLRESEFKGNTSYDRILELARAGKGEDFHGYRAEFIRLVEMCSLLKKLE